MIKDLVVNLAVAPERDLAAEFALSVANTFTARVTGIAFQLDAIIPTVMLDGIPPDVIETQRVENERAAKAAAERFDAAARASSVLSETRIVESSVAGTATRFAHVARRFDLSVVAQARPDTNGPEAS